MYCSIIQRDFTPHFLHWLCCSRCLTFFRIRFHRRTHHLPSSATRFTSPLMNSFYSLIPPIVAVALAIAFKQIYLALLAAIFLGCCILKGGLGEGLIASVDALVEVFQSRYNTQVILFCCLVGGLLALCEASGGVLGFVQAMQKRAFARSKRGVGLLACLCGCFIFIESSITCLCTGAIARPLAQKNGVSKEKLAYLCDSTSAPICMLIPLNSWGAYVMGLCAAEGVSEPLGLLAKALPLNFYAISAIALAFLVATSDRLLVGPMKAAELQPQEPFADENEAEPVKARSPLLFLLPVLTMICAMPAGLAITGYRANPQAKGFFDVISAGSGATAVLWAVLLALFVTILLCLFTRALPAKEIAPTAIRGIADLIPMSILMLLAFALCNICKDLQTGAYMAKILSNTLPVALLPALIFLLSAVISFATGTSFGTFGLMIPLALPLSNLLPAPLLLASVLSGGVFGDHCSPISDTTLVAAISAKCDLLAHVRTQIPYALIGAGVAVLGFLIAGLAVC